MKDKIFGWLDRNQQAIGYTVGGLNIANSVMYFLQGQTVAGILFLMIGIPIILLTYGVNK
jgi:hypothetical protein